MSTESEYVCREGKILSSRLIISSREISLVYGFHLMRWHVQRTDYGSTPVLKHSCNSKDSQLTTSLNFSPSGEWAFYSFRDYRDGGPMENDELAPKIAVR